MTPESDVHEKTPTTRRTRPVRTSPMGRAKKKPKPAPVETTASPDEATSPLIEPAPSRKARSRVEITADSTTEIERDPSEIERTVSYRERRQARMSSGTDRSTVPKVRYRGSSSGSRRDLALAIVAGVLILAFVAASVVFAVGINRQKDLDALRAEYSSFASQFIINLTSMNPSNVDQVLKTVQEDSSGKVKQQLQDSSQQAVGLVRDTNVETKTTILSEAVTKAEPDEGSVIMVFGWQQRSLDGKLPMQVQTFRWRVDMTRINGDLKVTNYEWVA
ncbi:MULTISPECIES: hypothetical protein [unclassified Gordonia (in: high G+C Gram-positive bacteria)]|uniref:hypothetical protein n=1 Tax=unclassified Gordonia (in: high G+C Gram-positive bacteria) TaxID=2657482 RepID=UPI001F0D5CA7|nr:hypothetical protein [Gordonia sp. ABSL49_1]MCH5644919.1 hypothetical protein [Gordonia sp. ABSL49_1]